MKALSIQQPWAWLIVNGYKDIENRDWPTRYRGPVLIHAGKKIDTLALTWLKQHEARILPPGIAVPLNLDTGGVVGRATIADCVTASPSKWFEGKYGFVLADAARLPLQPLRGQLGLFEVPSSLGVSAP